MYRKGKSFSNFLLNKNLKKKNNKNLIRCVIICYLMLINFLLIDKYFKFICILEVSFLYKILM